MKFTPPSLFKILFVTIAVMVGSATFGYSASVTLTWDANVPAPEGYRVFVRQGSQGYDYAHPIWEGSQTLCKLTGFVDGDTYHFVVRAFDGDLESADSQEVAYTPAAASNQAPTADAGQSQTVDEGATVTLDGSASSDADGSIASYQWEQTGGTAVNLDNSSQARATFTAPDVANDGETLTFSLTVTDNTGSSAVATTSVNVVNSAAVDSGGDGGSNPAGSQAGTDPTAAGGNTAPHAPTIDALAPAGRVSLTHMLVAGGYADADNDAHSQSQWQISTVSDFSTLVLDDTSHSQLTAYTVGAMVLDADTVYYWRVRFIDARHGVSDWSPTATFTTIAADQSDDTNLDGVPDAQAVDGSVDVDEDGIPDVQEADIMSVHTVEGQTIVGVKSDSDKAGVVAVRSIPSATIADQSVKMAFGLVGFKLYLQDGVTTASVTLYFSKPVPQGAKLYKYNLDSGWQVYENAVFAADGRSATLVLTDGGPGDEDGVANGVIVDPTGVAYPDSTAAGGVSLTTGATSGGGGGSGCFISTGIGGLGPLETIVSKAALWMTLILLAAGIGFAAVLLKLDKND
jgi:chitinase